MRRWHTFGILILVPALGLLVAAPGCSKKEEPPKKQGGASGDGGQSDNKGGGKKNGGGAAGDLTELATKGTGTLTGTVTYKGDPPKMNPIDMGDNKDKASCHAGASERELVEQTWLVNKDNKGVSDVIIFLHPPDGKFFKIDASHRKNKYVELRQPHCAFIPHVFPYWGSYYDAESGEWKDSGQKIKVINDAKFNHNTAWGGDPGVQGKGGSVTLAPEQTKILTFKADLKTPVGFNCDIHKWMNAKCLALDTPYCARTDENGKFKIENVPADVELYVVGWHQDVGYFYGGKTDKKKATVEQGKTKDLSISISK